MCPPQSPPPRFWRGAAFHAQAGRRSPHQARMGARRASGPRLSVGGRPRQRRGRGTSCVLFPPPCGIRKKRVPACGARESGVGMLWVPRRRPGAELQCLLGGIRSCTGSWAQACWGGQGPRNVEEDGEVDIPGIPVPEGHLGVRCSCSGPCAGRRVRPGVLEEPPWWACWVRLGPG